MAGESGGVLGRPIADGEGGARNFAKNRARRSTSEGRSARLLASMSDNHVLCFSLCAFIAIPFLRSADFFAPTDAILSWDAFNKASKRSRSRPAPLTGDSGGRRGESCLGDCGELAEGGGER